MDIRLTAAVVLLFGAQDARQPLHVRAPERVQNELVLVAEEVFQATVSEVVDGDSIVIRDRGGTIDIRLDGVDAPELSQASGSEAREYLRKLVMGRSVTVRRRSKGPAGAETMARLDVDGTDVSAALISAGLGWHCTRFAENRDLAAAEKTARVQKHGLWQDANPTPPWKHRDSSECWAEADGR